MLDDLIMSEQCGCSIYILSRYRKYYTFNNSTSTNKTATSFIGIFTSSMMAGESSLKGNSSIMVQLDSGKFH